MITRIDPDTIENDIDLGIDVMQERLKQFIHNYGTQTFYADEVTIYSHKIRLSIARVKNSDCITNRVSSEND